MAMLDVDSAFRNIPIMPAHKCFLVLKVREGRLFIDHAACFGGCTCPGLHGMVMDALLDVLKEWGFGVNFKWVDDMASFQEPSTLR